jgi:formylglycine-generating enzyme required for sulfatase activity
MRYTAAVLVLIASVTAFGQTMKVHVNGSSTPQSFQLAEIDSVTFEMSDVPSDLVLVPAGQSASPYPGVPGTVNLPVLLVSRTEITQAEYLRVLGGTNPSQYVGDSHPVENVTLYDAVRYCNARSKMESLDTCYTYAFLYTDNAASLQCDSSKNGYRLPCLVEFRYLSCGGLNISSVYYFDTLQATQYAWYQANNSPVGTKVVGQKVANGYGLTDICGNVQELAWGDPFFTASSPSNPRTFGGGYASDIYSMHNTGLTSMQTALTYRSPIIGFRIMRKA